MPTLMQSSNEPIAVSLSLPAPSNTSTQPEGITNPNQSKANINLCSIASAGLHVSRPQGPSSRMSVTNSPSRPVERLAGQNGSEENNSNVTRETQKENKDSGQETRHEPTRPPSDQMHVDSHNDSGNATDQFDGENPPIGFINSSAVASPGLIDETASQDGDSTRQKDEFEVAQNVSNRAFSYPMPSSGFTDPRRGLSLPDSGLRKDSSRPIPAKKHRCPYCSTEFTRHHNLKSHLLTHSQEKPYICQTCQSRFRRLHDLKRHTKLHTGERPHICPKCGRRFARGDALARHNKKGQGGCAGRRSSMGGYAPEEDYGDSSNQGVGGDDAMDGLVYAEPERMDEEEERRLNMSNMNMKKNDASSELVPRTSAGAPYQPRQPGTSTYPPIAAGRPSLGGLFPPSATRVGSSASTSPVSPPSNIALPPVGTTATSSVFQHSNMTESPKPLSPNPISLHQLGHGPESSLQQLHRPHSPSRAQSFQQQALGRTAAPPQSSLTSHISPSLSLPPPQVGAPQLPPPPGLSSVEPRFSMHGQSSAQQSSSVGQGTGSLHSQPSNHDRAPPVNSSVESTHSNSNQFAGPHGVNGVDSIREDKLWSYIRSVHEEVTALRSEVASLRSQLAEQANSSSNVNPIAAQHSPEAGPVRGLYS